MDLVLRRLGLDRITARSILVGGGSPTYLSPEQLQRFLQLFLRRVDLGRCRQFNYDVDPVTLVGPQGLERLQIMRDAGVDRLTIGVQSLDDDILRLMNRPHDVATAVAAIENSRRLGFQINIEFIFGLPRPDAGELERAHPAGGGPGRRRNPTLPPEDRGLRRFPGPIKTLSNKHPEAFPTLDETLMMKQLAIDILAEHGYRETLRRVFAKDQRRYSHYAHNQCCMLYDEIGFGLTAFSSLRDRFGLNTPSFEE